MERLRQINLVKLSRVLMLMGCDIVLINLAQFLALFVRFEFSMADLQASGFLDVVFDYAPWHTILTVMLFGLMGIYNSLWRYVSLEEAMRISGAAILSVFVQFVIIMYILDLVIPRSFPILNGIFLAILIIASRFSYRMLRTLRHGRHPGGRVPTMLIGAGAAGAMVLRDLSSSEMSHNQVVCIIDDDPNKNHSRLSGVPIVGGRDKIAWAVEKYGVKEIILAIPTCTGTQRRQILELCQKTGCATKILPGIAELANGTVSVRELRHVEIEDLLGRDSVQVDLHGIGSHIRGRTVLVTGGGGSIGSELCRQIAAREPGKLIIFDIYENNAYDIQQELKRKYPALDLLVLIGSVRDADKVEQLFARYRPEVVYHAAAHKHVPLMEDSPNEAVKNNVFGTWNVAGMADRYGTHTFVLISTDKAVNPTSVMGATKRVCEMIVQMFSRRSQGTKFVAVRFGNVLGSNGSVIPLFRKQIEQGGPVTVTHKEMIRYFMTIPEAVSLVLQAGVYAKGGEIFILDMGDPVKIDDLARNMIRLSGYEPEVDIPVVYTGLRPGEKLYEELLLREEGLQKTANDLIFVGHPGGFSDEELLTSLEEFRVLCGENSPAIVDALAKLVKNFRREQVEAGVR